jgi:iron(III) transport system substrate-binding protein
MPTRVERSQARSEDRARRAAHLLIVAVGVALAGWPFAQARAQAEIEDRLGIITTMPRPVVEPIVAAFTDAVRRQFATSVRVGVTTAVSPVAYGRIREWAGRPEADVFWGGEPALFDDLAGRGFLALLEVSDPILHEIPVTIGVPTPIRLKDPKGFWVGCCLTPYGIVWRARLLGRLGMETIRNWNDLLDCRLRGNVVQARPDRTPSSHASVEVILQMNGWRNGWEWMQRLGANTGGIVAHSRDIPAAMVRGKMAVGFGLPAHEAFESLMTVVDLKYLIPTMGFVAPEPLAVIAGTRNPRVARAFIQFVLSDPGQRAVVSGGEYGIMPGVRMEGPAGSPAARMAEFTGIRSFFDRPVRNIYSDAVARPRYGMVNDTFQKLIIDRLKELKALPCQ